MASCHFFTKRHEVQPDVYCRSLGLNTPISVSVKERQTADLWILQTSIAMHPANATPGLSDSSHGSSRVKRYLTATAIVGAILGAAFVGFKLYLHHRGLGHSAAK